LRMQACTTSAPGCNTHVMNSDPLHIPRVLQSLYGKVRAASRVTAPALPAGQIVAATAVAAGREVHNTYGELGNAELVSKYGFALPGNPFDAMRVDKAALVAAAAAELGPRACRARARFLALHRCLPMAL